MEDLLEIGRAATQGDIKFFDALIERTESIASRQLESPAIHEF